MTRFAAASALVLVFLAACERQDDPATEPPAAAETPQPETTPLAVTPVADNVLTAEGLGAARIGMSRAELVSAWGEDANPGGRRRRS